MVEIVGPEAEAYLDWIALTDAIAAGHKLPRAEVRDSFITRRDDTLLSRAAWIDGLGVAVKSATVFPGNAEASLPTVGGAVSLFDDTTGALAAMIDFALVTKWKTAGDSLLAARKLARGDTNRILIVGAGTVGASLREAYGSLFPDAAFSIWNRTTTKAVDLAAQFPNTHATDNLEDAVRSADVVTVATMGTKPIIMGEWLAPGSHLDLIGAYRRDMREADDQALQRGKIFVDSRATTVEEIGELADPIARGVIAKTDIIADFYDLDRFQRKPDDITVFKNGGGAHLDLLTSRFILDRWQAR